LIGQRGLTTDAVIDAAMALVESDGAAALTLSRVARELGVKPPSLYNHVEGLDDLRRGVGIRVVEDLGRRLGAAAMGRTGRPALRAVAGELRSYAATHPALYEVSAQMRIEDEAFAVVSLRAVEPVMAILRGFDLAEEETIHAARTLRASLYGFVSLERAGGFGLDVDVDASFEWLVDCLAQTLESVGAQQHVGGG
jgi:AcrR family transcriptional regulator